jgi:allophanate hydrolase subunit 2
MQCTPQGSLIILMRDAQVTGGYPRILQLNNKGINFLSQKKTEDKIYFKLLSRIE